MKNSIVELIHQDPVLHRCYAEGIARGLSEREFLELAVESLAKWKAEAIAREIAREANTPPSAIQVLVTDDDERKRAIILEHRRRESEHPG
jgi:hypothetical protein